MLILNFKTYKEATGQNGLVIAQIAQKISEQIGVNIIVVPQPTDIYQIKKTTGIEVWAQYIDPIDPDKHTGCISPYALRQVGATGVIINHSEKRLTLEEIKKRVKYAKKYRLTTLVLTDSVEEAIEINLMEPDYIGYEKKELIAGNVPIIEIEGPNIENIIDKIDRPLIVGSGIKDKDDIVASLKIGAKGVILASSVIKAQDVEEKILELAKAFKAF